MTRVARTLLESPFLIPQDLMSLDGFAVQRLAWGINFTRGRDRLGVTFAFENLADKYLSGAFSVRACAGPELYGRRQRRSVLGPRRQAPGHRPGASLEPGA